MTAATRSVMIAVMDEIGTEHRIEDDLAEGWVEQERYLVCPRHGWHFDLANHGSCTSNATTINAVCTTPASSSIDNNPVVETRCVAAQELSHLD